MLIGPAYPGMGTGDPDLYKAFCWRFWHLTAVDGGRIGVVLPRSALAAKGSTDFRLTIFRQSASVDITMLLNRGGWVFDDMEHRYSIGLVSVTHGEPEDISIYLRGPFGSHVDFQIGVEKPAAGFDHEQVLKWNDSAALPLLPTEGSVDVFAQLRKAPRIDSQIEGSWRARPARNETETTDRDVMDLESETQPSGFWPVYTGQSFDIWMPDTGKYYAWADPKIVLPWLYGKRLRAHKAARDSVHKEFSANYVQAKETLAPLKARVVIRDVTNRTNQRTLLASLIPPNVFTTENCPFFLMPSGNEEDEAFLLGVLSSIPMDWYARRIVETHLRFHVINPFPVPRPERDDAGWQRVVELAGRLACPDDRFTEWAEAVGVDCGPLAADEKEDMIHELDAVVALLYGLSEHQLVHIFETFHEGWDYDERLQGVLGHYNVWNGRT
jgi:hypothetical protein